MTPVLPFLGVTLCVGLFLLVLELVRRRRLSEELALVWLGLAAFLLLLSLRREILHTLASWLGIAYPPALLLLAGILVGFVALLATTVALSSQRERIEKLVEEVALLGEAVRRLEGREHSAGNSPGMNPRAKNDAG